MPETASRCGSAATAASASAATSTATARTSALPATTAAGSSRSRFQLPSKADRLADAKVHSELAGTVAVVDGNERLAGRGREVEISIFCNDEILRKRGRSGEGRAFGEHALAVNVFADGDVKWSTGRCDDERTDSDAVRRGPGSGYEHAVADVESGASIILCEIVLIRGKARRAGGVAVGVVQRVITKQGKF